jgi:very-short-patch-repair endonuclease
VITAASGNETLRFSGANDPATSAELHDLTGVALKVLILSSCFALVRMGRWADLNYCSAVREHELGTSDDFYLGCNLQRQHLGARQGHTALHVLLRPEVGIPSLLRNVAVSGLFSHTMGLLTYGRLNNVAASRAYDQMWLFHSVTVDDLSSSCLRRQLLEYCLNPKVGPPSDGIDVTKLRQQAIEARRADSRAPLPFDSWFEVNVFLQIVDRGFRVIPQFALAGKRIDLLIEGMRGRLAVECDGDQWHGAEEWDRDVDRQRMLERCGLRFWRVRGSAYYRDSATALQPLWQVLEDNDIVAGSSLVTKPSPAPITSAPADNTEPDAEEGRDDDERSRHQPAPDVSSGYVESAPSEDEAPLFSVTPLDAALILAPYSPWLSRPVPDPHSASISELIDVLTEIVNAEGPVVCRRVYSLYNKAAGNSRLSGQIVQVMNRAVYRAVKLGRLVQNDEQKRGGQVNQVVRVAGSPAINVRERGPRSLEDIPPLEIAAVREKLMQEDPGLEQERLVRQLAAVYGVVRKTPQVRKMLLV